MKLYSLYLTRKILSSFLTIVTSLVLLICFVKAVSFVDFVTEKGLGVGEFFGLLVLILPWLLLIIIPISLFLAVLITYNQMSSHNEIVILKNIGLSNLELAKPAILVAVICCLICFYTSLFLMPFANKKLRTSKTNFNTNYINLLINPGIFETINGLTIYVKKKENGNQLSGILIYDKRNIEYSSTILAKSGSLDQDEVNSNEVLIYLKNGVVEKFNYKTNKTETLNFDSYTINLTDNKQAVDSKTKWKSSERYLGELISPKESSSAKEIKNYYIEIHQRITYPLLPLIFSLIAVCSVLNSNFSRNSNLSHNVKAVFYAIIFIITFMGSYNLIEYSQDLVAVVYILLLTFVMGSFYLLKPR